jgi:hypothetical protein
LRRPPPSSPYASTPTSASTPHWKIPSYRPPRSTGWRRLRPGRLLPAITFVSPPSTLHRPARLHHPVGKVGRDIRGTPCCVAAGPSCPCGLHHRSIFAVIDRDFTEHDAIDFDIRANVHAARTCTRPSDQPTSRVSRHACPRECAYHRSSLGLPLHRSLRPQRRWLPMRLPRHVCRWWSLAAAPTRALWLRRPFGV